MTMLNKSICGLFALLYASTCMPSTADDQVRLSQGKEKIAVLTECANHVTHAAMCWVKFTDGTRCVIASQPGGPYKGSSTAINCEFSDGKPTSP